jgi:pimeloyl-ACP methyl ester carboxylesterase
MGHSMGGMGPNWDPSDMIATVEAEDAFDASERLEEIRAPTLVIGGERDPGYPRELFAETARSMKHINFVQMIRSDVATPESP